MTLRIPEPESALSERDGMLRALRTSEERLRAVVNSAAILLWALDRNGICTFSEGKGLEALGLRSGEVVGRSVFDLYAGHPEILADVRRALAGEEFTTVVAMGDTVLETRYTVLRDENGALDGVTGVAVDVTEQRSAERALREREKQLAATVDALRDSQQRAQVMADRMHAVAAAAAGVLGANSIDDLQDVLRNACRTVIPFDAFTFALYHPHNHTLTILSAYDTDVFVPGNTMSAAGVPMEGVIRSRRSLVTLRSDDPAAAGSMTMGTGRRSESIIRSPIIGPERVLGVLSVQSYKRDAYTREDVIVLETIASLAATALENIRLASEQRRAEEALRRSHQELEARVEERTAELAETNMALEEEIAERERAEEELRQKSSELEGLFQALPDLYFRLDAGGRVLDFAAGQSSPLLKDPLELVGHSIDEIVPEPVAGEIHQGMEEVVRTGALVCVEFTLPFEDREREVEARLVPFNDGQVITVVRDVTDQKDAERALQSSEEHFRRLIENSSDIATIVDIDGINRYQSPSIKHILGYDPEEIVGTSALDRIHPEDVPACREILRWMVEHPGVTRGAEFRYRQKNGGWRVLESRGRTLLPDSAAAGVVINSRDVTGRKEAEVVLERARQAAERANRAKSEFLSRMSHELRTPMNSILGFAQLLGRKELVPDQRRSVDHIMKAGEHLLNLINEILDISRIEANRHQLSLEPVRLSNVVCEGLMLIQPLAGQRAIRIDDCRVDPMYYVHADRQRLAQVLLNLLSNAVKYNREGGEVTLEYEVTDERVRLGVRDTGKGIPVDRMDQLFVPFERLGAEQTGVEGTGLGLALSKRLVEAMEGSLTVESVEGEGSVFWVELIRVSDPTDAAGLRSGDVRAATPQPASGSTSTILYVEDNLANLALIETILVDRPGVTLIPALQGTIGLDLAIEHRPDLVLLDLHLPDVPGDEVLRRLREHPRTRHLPVVVISADATPRRSEGLMRDGASAYLTKPLNVDEFLGTIDRLLSHEENTA